MNAGTRAEEKTSAAGTVKVSVSEYDLVVIGSGPAGQKAAIAAAKARKRVAVNKAGRTNQIAFSDLEILANLLASEP